MNTPWPIHSGPGGPSVEIASPRPIISAPHSTVQRVPMRSAMRPMTMPPMPEHSQASALASAGTSRAPPTSAAMSLSATGVIQAPPNAISKVTSATLATTQDDRLSIEAEEDCNINKEPGWRFLLQGAQDLTTRLPQGSALLLHCAKMRAAARADEISLQAERRARNSDAGF